MSDSEFYGLIREAIGVADRHNEKMFVGGRDKACIGNLLTKVENELHYREHEALFGPARTEEDRR